MKTILLFAFLLLAGITAKATEKYITTSDGVELYVKIKGQGTPLLYLHGGPGSGSYWFEKFFGEFMEQHFTVVYLDQRGVGRSSGSREEDYSIERMTKDFEEVRTVLGYKSWLTLGHSFGGILQMAYANQFPEAQKGMLMINGTLNLKESFCESWGPKAAEFIGNPSPYPCDNIENIKANLGYHIEKLREKDLFWKMAFEEPKNEKIVDATYNDIPNWNSNFSSVAFDEDSYWTNYKVLVPTIKVPVLFFYGEEDWMVGPNHYKDINFPNMMLWASTGGHFPFLENRKELEASILAYRLKYEL